MMKKYLPLFHNHHGKHCLIVGGGTVAMRRYLTLTEHGIKVDVISKDILPSLQDLLKQNGSHYTLEKYHESALRDFDMIIAATDDKSVNATIALHCKQKRIPVNVVSDPDLCDFIFPAVVERLPLQIAIAGGGASPILSRLLKNMVHDLIPPSYGKLASLVSDYRKDAKNKISDEKKRVAFWEAILQGPVAEAMFSGKKLMHTPC